MKTPNILGALSLLLIGVGCGLDAPGQGDVAGSTAALTSITSPPPGSTLASSNVAFSWTVSPGADAYAIWIGPAPATYSYFSRILTGTTVTATNLPVDGSTVYVRVWDRIAGVWGHNDYTYTAFNGGTYALTSPASGSTFTSDSQAFTWAAGADDYSIWGGSSVGTYDIFSRANLGAGTTSMTATALPTDGSAIYIRLWSLVGGRWVFSDYQFTTWTSGAIAPVVTDPVDGSTLAGGTQTVTWSGTADEIALWVGSSPGSYNIWSQTAIPGNSVDVTGLPSDGSTVYFRFRYRNGTTWTSSDSSYTAWTATGSSAITSPTSGSQLPGTAATFTWTAGPDQFALWAGTTVGSYNIASRTGLTGTAASLTGLPSDGSTVYLRFWYHTNGTWFSVDYTYVAFAGLGSVSAGGQHTCAVTAAGGVQCWGANSFGELGNNSTTESLVPVASTLTSGVAAVVSGYYHTCALTTAGGVKCWGANSLGQIGDNSTTNRSVPVDVSGLSSGVASIVVGAYHTCALMTAGGAQCWGYNNLGQLGDNSRTTTLVPVTVSVVSTAVAAIAAGERHTCALTTAGGVECWGSNVYGQLGDGTTLNRNSALGVTGLSSGVAAISAGWTHTCALTTAGDVQCWGSNAGGELGNNSTVQSSVPVAVSGLTGVTAISAGQAYGCALTTAGGVRCWGDNTYGQLGNNSTTGSLVPVPVNGLTSGVAALDAGNSYACALTTSNIVKCWGYNGHGQIGNNSTNNSLVPVGTL